MNHVNYVDLGLHSRSHNYILIMEINRIISVNISDTVQAIPVMCAVKIVILKVYMTNASPVTLMFTQGHTYVSNLTLKTFVILDFTLFFLSFSRNLTIGKLKGSLHYA